MKLETPGGVGGLLPLLEECYSRAKPKTDTGLCVARITSMQPLNFNPTPPGFHRTYQWKISVPHSKEQKGYASSIQLQIQLVKSQCSQHGL